MDLIRIGDKLVSRHKIIRVVDAILELRAQGASQQDVAAEFNTDRAFISRLEGLGEVRKGGRLALIGFPIGNHEAIKRVADEEGVELCLLLTDRERWKWVSDMSGAELFNYLLSLISELKNYDAVIFLGSDMRVRVLESILGRDKVIGIEMGASPLREDKTIEPDRIRAVIRELKSDRRM
ncbi:MAG: transcriptional regulator [Limnochordia bacterium]